MNNLKLTKLEPSKRFWLYNKALRLKEHGLGRRRVAKILNISSNTVGSWFYKGNNPLTKWNIPNLEPSPELAYVIGVFIGDGTLIHSYGHFGVKLETSNIKFARKFNKALCKILNKQKLYSITKTKGSTLNPTGQYYIVAGYSKILYDFLAKGKDPKIYNAIIRKFPISFLKGFYDSEGWMRFNKRYEFHLCNSNRQILIEMQQILKLLGIKSFLTSHKNKNFRAPPTIMYVLSVYRKADVLKLKKMLLDQNLFKNQYARYKYE